MIWKEIINFPDYQVSDTGEVKSTKYWGQFKRKNSEGLLSQRTYKSGYKYVNLYRNGHMYSVKVHRLVAQAFIPNPNSYTQINHKDENKSNNHVSNLEWCTSSYNITYNNLPERVHKKQRRKIGAFTVSGDLILEFESVTSASLYILQEGRAKSAKSALCNIVSAAKKDDNILRYGYVWKWLEESKRRE